jgi:hypothetical protein
VGKRRRWREWRIKREEVGEKEKEEEREREEEDNEYADVVFVYSRLISTIDYTFVLVTCFYLFRRNRGIKMSTDWLLYDSGSRVEPASCGTVTGIKDGQSVNLIIHLHLILGWRIRGALFLCLPYAFMGPFSACVKYNLLISRISLQRK